MKTVSLSHNSNRHAVQYKRPVATWPPKVKVKVKVSVFILRAFCSTSHSRRSGMDHTVLPRHQCESFHWSFSVKSRDCIYGRAVPSTQVARACSSSKKLEHYFSSSSRSVVLKTNFYANFYAYLLANCSNQ